MKIIHVPSESTDIRAIVEQSRAGGPDRSLVRRQRILLTAVDDFDRELALTRRNEKLIKLLEIRARQTETVPLGDVKRQLGLEE